MTSDRREHHRPSPPNWDRIEQAMWRANADEVASEVEMRSERIMKRVRLFVWRFGFSEQEVVEKIRSEPMFAYWFAKEPRRQAFHESVAADYLSGFPSIRRLVRLKQTGGDALYLNSDGEIVAGRDIRGPNPSKALDFEFWSASGVRCLASHKYTKEGGGNQDSQFNEQRHLLGNFLRRSSNNVALLVICDGPYYNDNRMATLRQQCRLQPPLSFALHIEDVPNVVEML